MEQPVEDLRTIMQYTLTKNLLFFKKNLPHLWETYKEYQPKQAALGLDEQGRLNLMTVKGALYPLTEKNPDVASLCRLQVQDYFKKPFVSVFNMSSKCLQGDDFRHLPLLREIVTCGEDYLERCEKSEEASKAYDKMPVFIVFGVGIGLHLDAISERSKDIDHLVIYEPDIDFFYASMHLVDYEAICREFSKVNKSFSLFVGLNQHDLFNKIYRFLFRVGLYKAVVTYFYKHYNRSVLNDSFEFVLGKMTVIYTGFGFFEDEIISAKNYNKICDLKKNFLSSEVIQPIDIPVFICANGPSLDYSIEYIKKNRKKAFVISCGSALSSLIRDNIYPDVHIEIERTGDFRSYINSFDPEGKLLKNVDLICNNTLPIQVMKLFKTATLFLKPNDYSSEIIMGVTNGRYKKILYLYSSNPTVFNAGLALAMHYKAKEIYLFGADLGFKDEEYHHSKNSVYYKNDLQNTVHEYTVDEAITIKGNFDESVKTQMVFKWTKEIVEDLIYSTKEGDCNIYNTSDGVFIEGTQPLRIADIRELEPCESFDRNWIKNNTSDEMISGSDYRKRSKQCILKAIELLDFFSNPSYLEIKWDDSNILDLLIRNHVQVKALQKQPDFFPVIRMVEGSVLHLNSLILSAFKKMNVPKLREEFINNVVPLYIKYFKEMKIIAEDLLKNDIAQ